MKKSVAAKNPFIQIEEKERGRVLGGYESPFHFQRASGHWQIAMGGGAWAGITDPATIRALELAAAEKQAGGAVQVVSKPDGSQVIVSKIEIEFKKIAQEIAEDTLKVGTKWLNLCQYIRKHKIAPKDATKWLLDLGFHKSKASEVNRVAQAADEVFSQFEARMIGWRGVLQLSRGNISEIKQAKVVQDDPELAKAVKEIEAELELSEENEKVSGGGERSEEEIEKERHTKRLETLNKSAVKVLLTAALLNSKPRKWNSGNGYILTLAKAPKGRPEEKKVTPEQPSK